jgi:hypothetical protein
MKEVKKGRDEEMKGMEEMEEGRAGRVEEGEV